MASWNDFFLYMRILIKKYIIIVSLHNTSFTQTLFFFFLSDNPRFTIRAQGKDYFYPYIKKKKYFHGSDYPL